MSGSRAWSPLTVCAATRLSSLETFSSPLEETLRPFALLPALLRPLGASGLLSVCGLACSGQFHVNGTQRQVAFRVWLLSVIVVFLGFLQAAVCASTPLLFMAE